MSSIPRTRSPEIEAFINLTMFSSEAWQQQLVALKQQAAEYDDALFFLLLANEIALITLDPTEEAQYRQKLKLLNHPATQYAHARHLLLNKQEASDAEHYLVCAAEQSFTDAQIALGKLFLWQDRPDLAYPWLTQAANNGNLTAMMLLVSHVLANEQTDEMKKWLHIAARQEHPIACQNLAAHYLQGTFGPSDPKTALSYFNIASKDEPTALISIALLLSEGIQMDTLPSNDPLYFWEKAAQCNQADAILVLADFYDQGLYVTKNPDYAEKLRQQVDLLNPDQPRQEHELKLPEKMQLLKQIYLNALSSVDIGPVFDTRPEAILHTSALFETHDPEEIRQWIEHIIHQMPQTQKLQFEKHQQNFCSPTAASVYQRIEYAAQAGEVDAQFLYGQLLLAGKHFPYNKAKALAWLMCAAKTHPFAQFFLAGLFRHGAFGIESNPSEAKYWLSRAADSQLLLAKYYLGRFQSEKNPAESLRHLKSIAFDAYTEETDEYQQWQHQYFSVDQPHIFRHKKDFLEKNARAGHPNAQIELGLLYEEMGRENADYYTKAFDAYSDAQHHITARFRLGCLYLNGLGTNKNEAEAFTLIKNTVQSWAEIASYSQERVPIVAMPYTLAGLYEKGLGTDIDIDMALHWYHRACVNYFLKNGQIESDFWEDPDCLTEEVMIHHL